MLGCVPSRWATPPRRPRGGQHGATARRTTIRLETVATMAVNDQDDKAKRTIDTTRTGAQRRLAESTVRQLRPQVGADLPVTQANGKSAIPLAARLSQSRVSPR